MRTSTPPLLEFSQELEKLVSSSFMDAKNIWTQFLFVFVCFIDGIYIKLLWKYIDYWIE